jgi:hypothetical protein
VAHFFNHYQLVLANFFGLQLRKHFSIAKNTLQLFLLFSTMFYSQDVVENIVARWGVFY